MLCEHKLLRSHKTAIYIAINSRSEFEIKNVLNKNSEFIILKLREHIKYEDEILYTITLQEFTTEELKEMNNLVK